jgi:hypothetical protein
VPFQEDVLKEQGTWAYPADLMYIAFRASKVPPSIAYVQERGRLGETPFRFAVYPLDFPTLSSIERLPAGPCCRCFASM